MTRGELDLLIKTAFKVRASQVQLIETHISWVVLAGNFAYKVKKPLTYDFLDFSSLAKRKKGCETELHLNRRLAPDVYLSVEAIRKTKKGFGIGAGRGEIVDYAVKMKKLQLQKQMHNMLQEGSVNVDHITGLAKLIANFHTTATIISVPFDPGREIEWFQDIRSTRKYVARHVGVDAAKILDDAARWVPKFIKRAGSRFQERVDLGFVRDLHGDLHSRNIFLYRKPVIFDCIEFNDDYRYLDMLNEIAFFCMDLDAHRKRQFSKRFLKEYVIQISIPELFDEELFHYFKCYRANIRAKVNALRGMQADNPKDHRKYVAETRKYLSLMEAYRSKIS